MQCYVGVLYRVLFCHRLLYYLGYTPITTTSYKVNITWQQELWYQNCGHNCKNRTNLLQGLKMQAGICCKHFERFSKMQTCEITKHFPKDFLKGLWKWHIIIRKITKYV